MIKATVLVDNHEGSGLQGEWGLAVYIEYGDTKILLDAGATSLYAENAKALGVDLQDVEYGVLSHAHFDHAGGLRTFLDTNTGAKFFLRKSAGENCYKWVGILPVYIGIPKGILKRFSDRICYVEGDYQLTEGVYLIPHKTPGLEANGKREKMLQRKGLRFTPDNFSHEQSLVLDTEQGLVIFNSCCHGGAANVIREIQETFPDKRLRAIIGGFHLYNKSEQEVRDFAKSLSETGIPYVCTGHCTKEKAYDILKEELGEKLHPLQVGLVMEF